MRFALGVLLCLFLAGAQCSQFELLGPRRALKAGFFPSQCSTFQGTDWYGNDIEGPLNTGSAAACCTACSNRADCKAFIYRSAYDHCYLKDKAGDPSPCEDCVGRNYDEDIPFGYCGANFFRDRFGGDMANMPIHTTSPGYCCEQCRSTPGCVSWTWRRDYNHCYLKHTRNEGTTCFTCINGDVYDNT